MKINTKFNKVIIDSMLLDNYVTDERGRLLGRPWLTILVDYYTKTLVTSIVTLEPPNNEMLTQLLKGLGLKVHKNSFAKKIVVERHFKLISRSFKEEINSLIKFKDLIEKIENTEIYDN